MEHKPNCLQLGFLLADTARILRRIIDKRAKTIGMSRAQWAVLSRISRNEGLRQVDLAGEMEMEPISVARIIDKLQAAGLVERRPDPSDRRAYRLHLLPAAAPVLEQVRAIGASVLDPALAHLKPEQLEALIATIGDLRANLLNIETENVGSSETNSAA
ncbi:MarR family winged helix-turn-helix transcriptional regulator [Terrihabitans soli]|nr:MarR family transcriptional regulator [Terrihabitans soli]